MSGTHFLRSGLRYAWGCAVEFLMIASHSHIMWREGVKTPSVNRNGRKRAACVCDDEKNGRVLCGGFVRTSLEMR